ncbi:MAG: hypothetical protein A2293_12915 [Elusimicrobia bacterium RIFOXYB2_FULL_49_7]|nr:MAG: hypothetical protein A2293_12915 [Elusimicrobia bacterium RIFOXYB2_FULL_49_7]
MRIRFFFLLASLTLLWNGCFKYSFSGSTLPGHIKTVSMPLIENQSSEIGLEERLREKVYTAFSGINLFRLTDAGGDAELRLNIVSFQNIPDEYDASGNVKTYRVIIETDCQFRDNIENDDLFKGRLRGIGIYSHTNDTRESGVESALTKLNEIIVNNTISGW